MSFPLGKPVAVMIGVALCCGAVVALRPTPPRADLVVWTFVSSHARSYRGIDADTAPSLVRRFEGLTGKSVHVKLLNNSALNVRLATIFDRGAGDGDCPDLVEVEIGDIGRYFRPDVRDVGFVPLDGYVDRNGWRDRLIAARLAPWSKDGMLFGIPHDVHPVSITYRKDLYDQAGVELSAAQTWTEFQDKCLEFQRYWTAHGHPERRAMELPSSSADYLTVMLLARGINALDAHNRVRLTDPRVAQTIAFYAQLVAGPRGIAADATPGGQLWIRDFCDGDLCAIMTPDWRAGVLRQNAPALAGSVAMMLLPRFDATDAPTATWGGTMIGIPKSSRHQDDAFRLAMFLYSSAEGVDVRWRETMILPPVVDLWNDPVFHQPDPFFAGQKTGEVYIGLARQIPRRYVTPFTSVATGALAATLSRAVELAESGATTVQIEIACSGWLREASENLQRIIDFGKFQP